MSNVKHNSTTEKDVSSNEILLETRKVKDELKLLNSHKLVRVYNSIPKLLFFQLIKGVSFGLGSVLGATIVVSLLAYLLAQVEFIPILGELVKNVILEIQK